MLNALLTKEVPEPEELEAYFLQAIYWSIGGALLEDGRPKFDNYCKYLASANIIQEETQQAGPGMLFFLFPICFFFPFSNSLIKSSESFPRPHPFCLSISLFLFSILCPQIKLISYQQWFIFWLFLFMYALFFLFFCVCYLSSISLTERYMNEFDL